MMLHLFCVILSKNTKLRPMRAEKTLLLVRTRT
jgi:hypothetical protein